MKKLLHRLEAAMAFGGTGRAIALLIASGLSLVLSLINRRFPLLPLPFDIAWVAIVLCGIPIIAEAAVGLITRFDIRSDVLVSLALAASVLIHEDFAAGEIAFIMQLGALLEDVTVARARAGIEGLVHLTPQTARLLSGDVEQVVPAEAVRIGDLLRVLPGETIPVDGVIVSGQTSINQAVMTGESLPVDKAAGDEVSSGTVNQFGAFEMRATKVGEDRSIQRMIRLVQSADAGRAKIVRLADRWATWIVVIALSAALLTWIITGEILRAVTILVVFCPCAMVLATPTAIMAAIGNATKHGFLIREGDALERLSKVNVLVFDKTGTLTCGTPRVVAVKSLSSRSADEVYLLAASLERRSEHPLGRAIARGFGNEVLPVSGFHMVPGEGVSGVVEGRRVYAGNQKLLRRIGLSAADLPEAEAQAGRGCTIIYVAVGDELAGYLVLSDTLRNEAADMIRKITALGITPVLLTGDRESAASAIAARLGISRVTASCLPEDKLIAIEEMQKRGDSVSMMGDGINDAPALRRADVGIAMGGIGSDIAIDAADIVLVEDEIGELPHLLALSRRMMATIKINLTFSMALNLLAIALAIAGALDPVVGALVHNLGSFLVILHSAWLLKWRK